MRQFNNLTMGSRYCILVIDSLVAVQDYRRAVGGLKNQQNDVRHERLRLRARMDFSAGTTRTWEVVLVLDSDVQSLGCPAQRQAASIQIRPECIYAATSKHDMDRLTRFDVRVAARA